MVKDNKYNPAPAKVILDINLLTIVDADVFFKNIFQDKWQDEKSTKITSLVDFDDIDEFKNSLKIIENGELLNHQLNGKVTRNNKTTPVVITISHIKGENKKWTNEVVGLTFQEKKEDIISPEKYLFDNIAEQIPAKIFVIDLKYQLLFFNSNVKSFVSYYFERALIKDKLFLPKNKNQSKWKKYFDRVFKGEKITLLKKYRFDKKDYIDLISLTPLKNNQSIIGCIFYAVDILNLELPKEQLLNNLRDVIGQNKLQIELDSRLRELSSYLILISQKNGLINTIESKLKRIISKVEPEVSQDIHRILALIKSQEVFDDNWEKLKIHFVKMNPQFFIKLKSQSDQITEKDLRHCAYMKMGFSVKETAQLLGIRPKSIEMARYRIKKKLKLDPQLKLSDFIYEL